MTYQKQLKEMNLSIDQLKEEKRQFIIENHQPEILMTMNQLLFKQEDFRDTAKQLNELMEDTHCLLRTMRQFTEEDSLELLREEYQTNCRKIEELIKCQSRLVNMYLNQINSYINKTNETR